MPPPRQPPPPGSPARAQLLAAVRADLQAGRAAQAAARLRGALTGGADAELLFHLGSALRHAGDAAGALAALERARRLAPGNPAVLLNLGGLYLQLDRALPAREALQAGLRLAPDNPAMLAGLAGAELLLGGFAEARRLAERATRLDPSSGHAWEILAQTLVQLREPAAALAAAEQATRLAPRSPVAWRALGEAGRALKDLERAADGYRRAHGLAPHDRQLAGTLLLLLQQLCAWEEAAEVARRLDALPAGPDAPPGEPLLAAVSRSGDGALHLTVARAWARSIAQRAGPPLPAPPPARPKPRLTIGYLSGDLRDHAVGHLVAGLFAAHDRARVAVRLYSHGSDASSVRRRIVEGADAVVEIDDLGHRAAAERIRADGVDILVDLVGHTRGSRLEICALRPAPLQVTWLGFPGTTGADYIDYLFGDPVVTPAAEQPCYAERLVLLPRPYQSNTRQPTDPATAEDRAAHGLPEGVPVLASMNASYKLDPVMWDCWMRLLRRLPTARLWLYAPTSATQDSLLRRAAAAGVEPTRIVFGGRLPHERHLGRQALADLALDTRIYTGHTTTSDSLRMGVPVVTLRGSHFASRVSESLLRGMGLDELVVADLAAYEALVVALVEDPGRRAALARRIRAEQAAGRLFDEADMARALEAAYAAIWQRAAAGQPPATLDLGGGSPLSGQAPG